MSTRYAISILCIALLASCDGRLIAAGNLALAVVPFVLLWVTVNLKKA